MTPDNGAAAPSTFWHRATTPAVLFVLAFVAFALLAGDRIWQHSPNNHFVYLADSFLHGTLEMRVDPPHGNDWATLEVIRTASGDEYRGVWWDRRQSEFMATDGAFYRFMPGELRGAEYDRVSYVSFPPMPAVLMLPFVAIWGMRFNDVLFTLLFAAANVPLAFVLLRHLAERGYTRLSTSANVWLALLLGFGTAHGWCAPIGEVWFTALIIGVTFTLLYMRLAVDAAHPFLAGLALGCAFATRTPLLYSVVFFAIFFLFPGGRLRRDWGMRFWRDGLVFGSAPLVIGLALVAMNLARFDDPGEFGHRFLSFGQIDRIKEYGLFNVHFLSRNLSALLALVPKFQPSEPWVIVSNHGLAIWFTTPALLWLLAPRYESSAQPRLLLRATVATILVIAIPHLFYQNTGWVQFGYRFSCDYIAYLTVLLALASRDRVGVGFKAAVVVSIGVNLFGALTFGRAPQHYADWMIEPE